GVPLLRPLPPPHSHIPARSHQLLPRPSRPPPPHSASHPDLLLRGRGSHVRVSELHLRRLCHHKIGGVSVVESQCGVRPGLKTAVPYDYLDTGKEVGGISS
ncbi:unnamed protein product, partial [Musa acuminata subsp. malaccensis]